MRTRWIASLVLAALIGATAAPSAADDALPSGVLVAIGAADREAIERAAGRAGGASWEFRAVGADAALSPPPPADALASLRAAYVEGDFLGCLARLRAPELDADALLAAGHQREAGAVLVIGAACALGAGDADLARRTLHTAHAASLDRATLAITTPELQALDEAVTRAVAEVGPATLEIVSRPTGARVRIDGSDRCTTPCELALTRGRHVLTIARLGSRDRTLAIELERDDRRTIALDPAPTDVLEAQLGGEVAAGRAPDDAELAMSAADAWGARVVVLVWRAEESAHAALWDRGLERFVARVSAREGEGDADVVEAAIREWRGVVEPTEVWEEPAFWIVGVAVAAIAAGVTWALAAPPERTYALEIR